MQKKSQKKLLDKNVFNFSILILLFFVFFQEFKIFSNIFYLLNKDHDKRATSAYEKAFFSGYCKGSSHGYLLYIKNKYSEKFNKNKIPKIVNNLNGRTEYWVFLDINARIDHEQIIVLGNKNNINFEKYRVIDQHKDNCFFIEKKND